MRSTDIVLEVLSEQLGNDVDVKLKYIYELEEKLETAKAEARKEFAERLKPILFGYYDSDIDNLVKEMESERE